MDEIKNTVVLKLTEWELNIVLNSIKDYIQVIADELEDDWKYKDTEEYKAKAIDLKSSREFQDTLLSQQELLNSEPCEDISPQTQIRCELPKDHLLWPDNKGFYHRRGSLVWHAHDSIVRVERTGYIWTQNEH
jgi:hypothetical protein